MAKQTVNPPMFAARTLNPRTMMYEALGLASYPVEMKQEAMEQHGILSFFAWKERIQKAK